jgi:hypothetical protein
MTCTDAGKNVAVDYNIFCLSEIARRIRAGGKRMGIGGGQGVVVAEKEEKTGRRADGKWTGLWVWRLGELVARRCSC